MVRKVKCAVLKKKAPGLETIPYPGELGQRIYDEVSAEGWDICLRRVAMIINEDQLNSDNPKHQAIIEEHLRGFLFQEGDGGRLPEAFTPASRK